MGRASSDKDKAQSRGALVHGSTVTEKVSGGGRRLRLLLIYVVQVSTIR